MSTPVVTVEIQDAAWEKLASFEANDKESFYQMALHHGVEIPVACASGACTVCACKILEWQEHVDPGKLSVPLVDVEEDWALACVAGVFESAFSGEAYRKIVLKRLT